MSYLNIVLGLSHEKFAIQTRPKEIIYNNTTIIIFFSTDFSCLSTEQTKPSCNILYF